MRFIEYNKFLLLGWPIVMLFIIHYIATGNQISILSSLLAAVFTLVAHGASKMEG